MKEFKILKDDPVEVIWGMPGPDCFHGTALADQDGDTVLVRYNDDMLGKIREEHVKRSRIIWLRGSSTSDRFHAEQQA